MDILNPLPLVTTVPNWRIEDGSENREEGGPDICHAPSIEYQEREVLWYTQHFLGKDHSNYIGVDETQGPYALSILREDAKTRAILWRPKGPETVLLQHPPNDPLASNDILKKIAPLLSKKKLKELKKPSSDSQPSDSIVSLSLNASSAGLSPIGLNSSSNSYVSRWEADLSRLEAKIASRHQHFKFGILYVKASQKCEEEMFGNRKSSPAFKQFCQVLGDKIELKDWPHYNAGLDTRADRTGKHSIFTRYCGYDIMFHVSTMLPWVHGDSQQIDRKRHIGNDIVIIVFMEENAEQFWSPTIISSRFPHIYAIVKPITLPSGQTAYTLNMVVKDNVSVFGPPLPQPPTFYDPVQFRQFLLSKLINGERETIRSVSDFHGDSAFLYEISELYEKSSKSSSSSSSASTVSLSIPSKEKSDIPVPQSSSSRDLLSSSSKDDKVPTNGSNSKDPKEGPFGLATPSKPSISKKESFGALPISDNNKGSSLALNVSQQTSFSNASSGISSQSSGTPGSLSRLNLHSSPNLLGINLSSSTAITSSVEGSQDVPRLPAALLATTEQIQSFQTKQLISSFPAEITCCDSWEDKLVVGTVDGMFTVDLYTEPPLLHEVKCQTYKEQPYRKNWYKQLTVIEPLNVMVALIPKTGVVLYDLSSIENLNGPNELLLSKTKATTVYTLGTYAGCIHLACSTHRGVFLFKWEGDAFVLSQMIQVPPPIVMEFESRGYIVTASQGEVAFIKPDPENPTIHSLFAWSEKDKVVPSGISPGNPIDVILFDYTGEYLLCFDNIAFFVNSNGIKSRSYDFRWISTPAHVIVLHPYLLAFSETIIEIRYIINGALVQLFEIDGKQDKSIKFLTIGNGIYFATVGEKDTSGSLPNDGKNGSASTSNGSGKDSSSTSPGAGSTAITPRGSSSNFSLHAFNSTKSTIHALRLNTAQTSYVSNPLLAATLSAGENSSLSNSSLSKSSNNFEKPSSFNNSFGINAGFIVFGSIPYGFSPTNPMTFQTKDFGHTRKTSAPNKADSTGPLSARRSSAALITRDGSPDLPSNYFTPGSSPHSPSLVSFMVNDGTASFDDSEEIRNFNLNDSDMGASRRRQVSPGRSREGRHSMQFYYGGSSSNGSPSASYTHIAGVLSNKSSNEPNLSPGPIPGHMARFKSTEDMSPQVPQSGTLFTKYGDDAITTRSSSSVKVARRKSLAIDGQELRRKISSQNSNNSPAKMSRGSSRRSDPFDYESNSSSSESNVPNLSGSSPSNPGKSIRKASDKLSGSGEKSPRTSSPHDLNRDPSEKKRRNKMKNLENDSPSGRAGSTEFRTRDRDIDPSAFPNDSIFIIGHSSKGSKVGNANRKSMSNISTSAITSSAPAYSGPSKSASPKRTPTSTQEPTIQSQPPSLSFGTSIIPSDTVTSSAVPTHTSDPSASYSSTSLLTSSKSSASSKTSRTSPTKPTRKANDGESPSKKSANRKKTPDRSRSEAGSSATSPDSPRAGKASPRAPPPPATSDQIGNDPNSDKESAKPKLLNRKSSRRHASPAIIESPVADSPSSSQTGPPTASSSSSSTATAITPKKSQSQVPSEEVSASGTNTVPPSALSDTPKKRTSGLASVASKAKDYSGSINAQSGTSKIPAVRRSKSSGVLPTMPSEPSSPDTTTTKKKEKKEKSTSKNFAKET